MTDTLEVRIAHLEGAYEQIDKRLGGVESGLGLLRSEIGQLRSELTGRMDTQFRWLLGTTMTMWMTVLLAIFFRS